MTWELCWHAWMTFPIRKAELSLSWGHPHKSVQGLCRRCRTMAELVQQRHSSEA